MEVTWSWPVFLAALVILAVVLMPMGAKEWQDALKVSAGFAFAGGGAAILLSGTEGEILVTALLLLSAGILWQAQAAVSPEYRSWLLLVWSAGAIVVAVSPWDGLVAWLHDMRWPLVGIGLSVVGRLGTATSRKHLRGGTDRPGPHDRSRPDR